MFGIGKLKSRPTTMGSTFSNSKRTSESSRPSISSGAESTVDAARFSTSTTTIRHQEQTRVMATYTSTITTTKLDSAPPKPLASYTPVYSRPSLTRTDARPNEYSPSSSVARKNSTTIAAGTSDKYDLSKKAYVLVLHHYEFQNKQNDRPGSMHDMTKIRTVLDSYRVDTIKVHNNCTLRNVRRVMDGVSQKDFRSNSCIIVFIMSHGQSQDSILAYDGEYYSLHADIVEKCTANATLKGKPKIFVIQSCRGSVHMDTDAVAVISDKLDVVIFQSSYEGTVSFRHPEKGSVFMQQFLELLESCDSSLDTAEMNMRINAHFRRMSHKQTPTMTTTLQRRLYFNDLRKQSRR